MMIRQAAGLALVTALVAAAPALGAVAAEVLKNTEILLVGHVVDLSAATMADLPEGVSTIVVQVDNVVEKPPAVVLSAGDRMTMAVADPNAYTVGTQYTFYTVGWIFGDTLAVRELAHESVPMTAMTEAFPQEQQAVADAKLQDAIASADAVIAGHVVSVTRPLVAEVGGPPITEHDPDWHEAVVAVDEWIKGGKGEKSVMIRFPASIDVQWYLVPKLTPGDRGTFLLHNESVAHLTPAPAGRVSSFLLLSPVDVQPSEAVQRARLLAKPPS
jgi:hypothetical protein